MKLSEKGRYAPPPPLPKHAQALAEAIAEWPEVHARTHWYLGDESTVDGADFYVGAGEVGHIHLDGEAHIAFSVKVAKALIDAGLAEPFAWGNHFVVCRVRRAIDIAAAKALFRLAYDRCRGASEKDLLERIRARAAYRFPFGPRPSAPPHEPGS